MELLMENKEKIIDDYFFICIYVLYTYVMRCAISYHLYNLKNVKNAHGGVLILVKLQASACNFTKINTPPWVFSTFFKLYKWYQITQCTTYLLQPNLLRSKQNFMKIIHQMYNSTLAPYLCKSKYRSYRAPFEYSLAFKMVTKPTSTLSGHFYVYTSLYSDIYNCT